MYFGVCVFSVSVILPFWVFNFLSCAVLSVASFGEHTSHIFIPRFACCSLNTEIMLCSIVGHGSGPSVGRVGLDWVTKFSVLDRSGWVGSNVKNVHTIRTQETDYSTTIIHNNKKF